MKKTILITGASAGIGRETAKLFQKKGWNVIATMRSPEKEPALNKLANVLVTRLDVQDQQSIYAIGHFSPQFYISKCPLMHIKTCIMPWQHQIRGMFNN